MMGKLTAKFKYELTGNCPTHSFRTEKIVGPKIDENGIYFEYHATCEICAKKGYQRFDLEEKDIWGEK